MSQKNEELDPTHVAWPGFMHALEPELSESSVSAAIPDNLTIETPSQDVSGSHAKWSGIWSGGGSEGRSVDVKLVVEQVTSEHALIVCVFNSSAAGQLSERLQANLKDDQLWATMSSGATINFRMRHPDAVEFMWKSSESVWMSGVLSHTDLPSAYSSERIPLSACQKLGDRSLEVIVFRPAGEGPYPTLLFNHGACGTGADAEAFKFSWASPPLAKYFTDRGYMVMFPQRSGRGKSDGAYEEGLESDGSGYSMQTEQALAGFDRAMEDVHGIVGWVLSHDDVDTQNLILGGQSRGGLLALAYAAQRPALFKGVINFVGGWVSELAPSVGQIDAATFSRAEGLEKPSLWLYAESDSYQSITHSHENFIKYIESGGRGSYESLSSVADHDGHYIVFVPSTWGDAMDDFLVSL